MTAFCGVLCLCRERGQRMAITIPLGEMTIADKLRALEEIWEDLQRTPKDVPSPSWHGDVLRARESRIRSGASRYGDWTAAKRRIRKQTQ
jgi:hypothetical protein